MSSLPFNLVGSFDDIDARLVIKVELDARTGEIVSITGDRDAIRQSCAFLRETVGTSGTNRTPPVDAVDSDERSDEDIRECARPANILAALRQGRPILSAAPRPTDDECERELRSTSMSLETSARERKLPGEGHLAGECCGDPQENVGAETVVREDSPVGRTPEFGEGHGDVRLAAIDARGSTGRDRSESETSRRSPWNFVTGLGGELRLVPAPRWEPGTAEDAADR